MRTFVFCSALRATQYCTSEILQFNYSVIWGESLCEAFADYREVLRVLPPREEGSFWEVVAMYEDSEFTALQYHLNWAATHVQRSAF